MQWHYLSSICCRFTHRHDDQLRSTQASIISHNHKIDSLCVEIDLSGKTDTLYGTLEIMIYQPLSINTILFDLLFYNIQFDTTLFLV